MIVKIRERKEYQGKGIDDERECILLEVKFPSNMAIASL